MSPVARADPPASPVAAAFLDVLGMIGSGGPPAIRWTYPLQPEPLRRPRVDRGRGHLTDEDQTYRDTLIALWRAAKLVEPMHPLEGDLFLALAFAGNTKLGGTKRAPRPDRTNLEKAIEDAGNPSLGWWGLWNDDSQIVMGLSRVLDWGPDVRPFVSLEVWELPS